MIAFGKENGEKEKTTRMKLVSVVVPTYRREIELKKALESLAAQSYSNIEIILVDDNGSLEWNKKVFNVAEGFRVDFSEIPLKLLVNDCNLGSAETRNVGIAEAEGEYITFLDDDDVYLPDKVKKQVEFMESGHYDYSITDLILYTENDKRVDVRTRSYIKDVSALSLRTYHLKYHMTGTDVIMFRRDYLVQIGGFPAINIGDEFYLMGKAIDGGGKFGYLPGCDVRAYVHTGDGGLSSGDGKIKGENEVYEYKKTFFNQMTPGDVRYIKMRHYAVLAYAELRRGKYGKFVYNAMKSFCASPVEFFTLLK